MIFSTCSQFTYSFAFFFFLSSNIGKILVSLNTNLTKDKEKSGLACYNKCNESFSGFGPLCLQNCPSGFRDDGAYCFKTKSPIGRGVGYPWRAGDSLSLTEALKRCEDANGGPDKCETWGLIVYPKCPSGYYNVDCCLCSEKCPPNMVDIGLSCQKQSYWRGLGQLCINSTVIDLLG
jgi:hypothetical protein